MVIDDGFGHQGGMDTAENKRNIENGSNTFGNTAGPGVGTGIYCKRYEIRRRIQDIPDHFLSLIKKFFENRNIKNIVFRPEQPGIIGQCSFVALIFQKARKVFHAKMFAAKMNKGYFHLTLFPAPSFYLYLAIFL